MRYKFKETVLQGNFDIAKKIFQKLSNKEATDILIEIALSENILGYAFVCELIRQKDCVEYHLMAVAINECACFVNGSYELAFYHMKRICQATPVIKYLEHLLFYNDIPDKLLSDSDAFKLASYILKEDSSNQIALAKVQELAK